MNKELLRKAFEAGSEYCRTFKVVKKPINFEQWYQKTFAEKCGVCSNAMTLVRPGMYQCDNKDCKSNNIKETY